MRRKIWSGRQVGRFCILGDCLLGGGVGGPKQGRAAHCGHFIRTFDVTGDVTRHGGRAIAADLCDFRYVWPLGLSPGV